MDPRKGIAPAIPLPRVLFTIRTIKMTDFHTHILPGIDDGSRDIDMTMAMLEAERDMGVTHIYATPHFYAHRKSVSTFLDRRNKALSEVRQILSRRTDLPAITEGAEVYYFTGIGRAEHLSDLCIAGTDILLLEMPFAQWNGDMVRAVDDLIRKRGLRVVLAHVERYERFQKDRSAWHRIIEMPLTLQMNAESFIETGSWLRPSHAHKLCMRLIEEHENCIIGSDCHDMTERPPNIAGARQVIEQKAGAERLTAMDRYTNELLGI